MNIPATPRLQQAMIGYERELKEINKVIEGPKTAAPPHIAIIAEPLKGRTTIVDEISRVHGDRVYRITLDRVMTATSMPDLSPGRDRIILIDNCEFLATRKIGGFDLLNHFLKTQVGSKNLFITTWNSFAWQYLDQVMNLGKNYPVQITLPRMDTPVIKEVILSRYGQGEIQCVDEGRTERSHWYSIVHHETTLPFIGKEVTVPWITLNFSVMRSRLPGENRVQVSLEDVIFEKINRIADGNPGIALDLFQDSLEDHTISPRMIRENDCSLSLDINESFLLSLILSMNCLQSSEISAMVGRDVDIDRIIYRLLHAGIITEEEAHYRISPSYLTCVAEYLKRNRRVW